MAASHSTRIRGRPALGPVHADGAAAAAQGFAREVAGWVEHDGVAQLPPLLMQPIAPADVADLLARVAVGAPQGRHRDIAGPEPQDLIDMARRTLAVQGRSLKLVPTWHGGIFDETAAGDALMPAADAETAPTTFDEWLAAQRIQRD
ncbi:hypothetical protein [Lentzea flava]|uniref:Uncharacterized protein n=1 Tax=Lentzea flava TaxID=103732 RepID=A0ABQ2V3G9_9PSEU|nr:hypothetical protein [Lentzea flava]GGU67296.1 hypothetical protein GCM10010178_68890 [Lentzea flava]